MPKKTKSPEGPRKDQLKFYVTKAFKNTVDSFHAEHTELGSMGDFGIAAFRYFMEKYTEAGFHRDRRGFPALLIAAEPAAHYHARAPAKQKS